MELLIFNRLTVNLDKHKKVFLMAFAARLKLPFSWLLPDRYEWQVRAISTGNSNVLPLRQLHKLEEPMFGRKQQWKPEEVV